MYLKNKGALAARKKKKEDEAETKAEEKKEVVLSAAALRIQSDMTDLEIPSNVKLVRKQDDLFNFSIVILPNQGYWNGASFEFTFAMPNNYPYGPPKVRCVDKIYHPNIDLEGNVCVNVLRPWKPTYTIQIILFGLLFLFTHPNPNDPLNKEAAEVLRNDKAQFARSVTTSLRGGRVEGVDFVRNKGPSFKN